MKKEIICTLIVIACAFLLSVLFDIPKSLITMYLHENILLLSAIISIIAGTSGGMSIASGKEYKMIGVTIEMYPY